MPYLIDDASPANSESTLVSTFFGSVYFDSVAVATVVDVDACVVLLLLLLLSVVELLICVLILLPLPSSRCSFGECATVDGAAFVYDLTVHTVIMSVVFCLSSVELNCDVGFATNTATASMFCETLAFCPCSNAVATVDADAGNTLFINGLIYKQSRRREIKMNP